MDHDEHFLRRIDRLNTDHAELALSLYRDHGLLRYLLTQLDLPPDAERVALALGAGTEGPFIVVARDGHFVTCLAEGMRLQPGQPVVPRHKLDRLSDRVADLRQLLIDSENGERKQSKHLMHRVIDAGDRLSREEFLALARWLPLLCGEFLRALIQSSKLACDSFETLSHAKKLGRRNERVIKAYWKACWTSSHLTLLLGMDHGEQLTQICGSLEDGGRVAVTLPWGMLRLGLTSFAARGAWLASKLPKLLIEPIKQYYADAQTLNQITAYGLSLSAMALRHKRYRAEVTKCLARIPEASDPYTELLRHQRRVIQAVHEEALAKPDELRVEAVGLSRRALGYVSEGDGAQRDAYQSLPDDDAVAWFLRQPLQLHGKTYGLLYLTEFMPWITSVEAGSFYLPEVHTKGVQRRWSREEGELLVQPRLDAEKPFIRPAPARAESTPGRNEPCPCGSGRKYKKCCLLAATQE